VWRILRTPKIRLYFLGDAVSTLGDYALWIAMAIWVKELTGSSSQAGIVFLMLTIGSLTSPLSGVLVDRVRRKPLLQVLNLTGAALMLCLLLVHDRHQVWLIDVVVFCYGVNGGAMGPAQTALLPRLVGVDRLAEANGLLQTQTQGLRLVTPLLGAGLFSVAGGHAVALVDAATFVVAAVMLVFVPVDEQRQERVDKRWLAELTAGGRHLWRTRVLRQQLVALGAAMLVIGFMESVPFSIVTQGLHRSASFVGVLVLCQGVGAIIGGPTSAAAVRRFGGGRVLAVALAVAGLAELPTVTGSEPVVMVGCGLFGLALPWIVVAANTTLQQHTPNQLMGRVSGASNLAATIPQAVSIAGGAALLAMVAYQDLIYAEVVVLVIAALYLISRPEQRRRTEPAADPVIVPDGEPVIEDVAELQLR
jgi:MFS family permease